MEFHGCRQHDIYLSYFKKALLCANKAQMHCQTARFDAEEVYFLFLTFVKQTSLSFKLKNSDTSGVNSYIVGNQRATVIIS